MLAGLLAGLTVALGPVAPDAAAARPLELEDLLRRESLGTVAVAPGGRWLLVEHRAGPADAPRFDAGRFNPILRTRLRVADLRGQDPWRALLPPDPGAGEMAGPISPDGTHVAVYRLGEDRWELGIAVLATGAVRWTGLVPEAPSAGQVVQWLDPNRLAVIALPPGALPYDLRAQRPQRALPPLWAAAARGEAAVTAVGSGRYRDLRPRAAPKRLVTIAAADGRVTEIARGDFVDLEPSPDGRRLALLEAGPDIPLAAGRPVQGDYGVAVRRMRLRIVDLATGTMARPDDAADVLASLLSWSPDGDRLLIYVRSDGAPWSAGRLVAVDARSGRATPLGGGVAPAIAGRPERVLADWMGATPVVFGRTATQTRDDWQRLGLAGPVPLTAAFRTPPASVTLAGDRLLAIADGAAWSIDDRGRTRRLGAGTFAAIPTAPDLLPNRTRHAIPRAPALTAVRTLEGARSLVRIGPAGPAAILAELPPGTRPLAAAPAGAVIVSVRGGGAETLVWRAPGAPDRHLAALNPHLEAVRRPAARPVRHAGPDGTLLTSWLFAPDRPPGAPPPPLVVAPYPGAVYAAPPPERRLDGPMVPVSALVGRGYAVLMPSLPAAAGGPGPADGMADRLLAIVEAARRDPDLAGRFDPDRIGLWGHSFGAYATVTAISQTDRFRAAVAIAPVTDLAGVHGQFLPARRVYPDEGLSTPWSAGWTESLQADMGAPPWEAPERYRRNSPLMAAGRIATPLLLAYGEIDGSHPAQAEVLFSALYRQDKDAILLTYWGEPHLFGSPGSLRDLHRRAFDFLESRLGPSLTVAIASPSPHPGPASASSAPTIPAPPPR